MPVLVCVRVGQSWGQVLGSAFSGLCDLSNSLATSEPLFLHLQNGDCSNPLLRKVLRGL